MNNEIYILIPSRIGSTRLKNKPLIKLKNKTLIQRVITNALKVTPNAYVATDSEQIKDNINEISNILFFSYILKFYKIFIFFLIILYKLSKLMKINENLKIYF